MSVTFIVFTAVIDGVTVYDGDKMMMMNDVAIITMHIVSQKLDGFTFAVTSQNVGRFLGERL